MLIKMQDIKIRNNLFAPNDVKCVAVNKIASSGHDKNFHNSLQNAYKTLGCLERSIRKSNQYEQELLHCKGSHSHSHGVNEWWDSEQSEDKSFKCSNTNTTSTSNSKMSRSQDDYTESWSTMSIVCLQYQYEELAKRYKALLQAYDEQCHALGMRDKRLEKLRERANTTHEHLTHAHNALICIGEKYLKLKHKRHAQRSSYEKKMNHIKQTLHNVLDAATRARLQFDARLAYRMAKEHNSEAALLLYEIRKCNLLFLENMQLKAIIEEHIIPGYDVCMEKQ